MYKRQFLGSSFAYLGGFSIVAPMLADADGNLTVANTKMLPYACAAIAFSGLVYLVASLLISTFGIRRIMKFFPPVVTEMCIRDRNGSWCLALPGGMWRNFCTKTTRTKHWISLPTRPTAE